MKSIGITSQVISPPIIFSVTEKEKDALFQYSSYFQKLGFEIEPFGGNEYAFHGQHVDQQYITAVHILKANRYQKFVQLPYNFS